MSTPDGEPLLGQDYETRERLIAWDVPRVAADREAMKAALKEYIVRLMFEHGDKWDASFENLIAEAEMSAIAEYEAAPIIKGGSGA